jgi:hypothetical protein
MIREAGPTAALAGVPAGVQSQGVWIGRRQLFVRFAGEAETAQMYTADALARELKRMVGRAVFHSIAISGRDALGNVEFLQAAFKSYKPELPVMLDTDGQRPEVIADLKGELALVQVTIDFTGPDANTERAIRSIATASGSGCQHALVLAPRDETSDAQLLRVVEQVHQASDGTMIVVHPSPSAERGPLDRRWGTLIEQSAAVHKDVRLMLRLPPPAGMR